jgi:hypothetical protein
MKNLWNNWNMPNDVGVIYNIRKQTRWEKASQAMKGEKIK